MWLEALGVVTGVIGTTAGTTAFIKHQKMPFAERRSIRNVQRVLTGFIEGRIKLKKEPKIGVEYYGFQAANFEIHLYAYEEVTKVSLEDTDLAGSHLFFDFTYINKTKELREVNEASCYYERYGHYAANYDVLKAFIEKVMSIDWRYVEKEEKERLTKKYAVTAPIVTVITENMPVLENVSWELQQLLDAYVACYDYVKQHPNPLDLETAHAIERDYVHVQMVCNSFIALEAGEQTKASATLKLRVEEKMNVLAAVIKELETEALYEFQKITEIMKQSGHN